jgi:hypothetical protein
MWKLYGFLDWLSWRIQDLAIILEDEENDHMGLGLLADMDNGLRSNIPADRNLRASHE